MFDMFFGWKRKPASESQIALVPSQHNEAESHRGSTGTRRGSRQFLSISQPIPRSSPSSLSGSVVRSGSGSVGEGGSIVYATTGLEDSTLIGIEDNRPMGSFGRRRIGSVSGEFPSHSDESYLQGTHASSVLSAPEVVRMDPMPPRHLSFEQQQQQYPQVQLQHQYFHYPTPRANLRLQTNIQPQHASYSTQHQNQSFMHHISQQQHRQPHPFYPHQIKQLSPIAEASPTSTSADYQSLKKAGSEILAGSPSPGGMSNNGKNLNVGGRRSGSVGSGPSIHVSAGSEDRNGCTHHPSVVTGASVVGSSRRQSSGTILTVPNTGAGTTSGMFGGNGGGLSSRTATAFQVDAGSLSSQYTTPTSVSASPDGPEVSPNAVVPSPISASGTIRSATPDVSRPSPIYSSPFINRTLNRTASQTSSRGRNNSVSTVPGPELTNTKMIANMTGQAAYPEIAVNLERHGSLRSVATSVTRHEQELQSQQQSFSRSGTPTLIGSWNDSGGSHTQNPVSSSNTVVSTSDPPMIPPLNLSPPFPGPHPCAGPRAIRGRTRSHVTSGSWNSKGKKIGVDVMPRIPGSSEGCYNECDDEEYDEGGGEYIDEDKYYDSEERYEEGTSAPGEEASGGYGYGYGYGLADEAGYIEEDILCCADQMKRDDDAEAGPSKIHVGRYVDWQEQEPISSGQEDEPRFKAGGPRVLESRIPSSESFITRRWSRDRQRGILANSNGMRHSITNFFHLRAKNQRRWFGLANFTPAFWAFWLGFICPILWLVGGWHFTNFGEQPPRMGVWEFYFSGKSPEGELGWKEMFCCCFPGKKRCIDIESVDNALGDEKTADENGGAVRESDVKDKGKSKEMSSNASRNWKPERTVPRWISEKQSSDGGRARLNDPNHLKHSLRGISFGYPFVPRPANPPTLATVGRRMRLRQKILRIVGKPNRLLDQLYGVRLKEVRGRPESGRRMFDPWIQRCRYGFCYACTLAAIGLFTVSMYLIVYNTRQLR